MTIHTREHVIMDAPATRPTNVRVRIPVRFEQSDFYGRSAKTIWPMAQSDGRHADQIPLVRDAADVRTDALTRRTVRVVKRHCGNGDSASTCPPPENKVRQFSRASYGSRERKRVTRVTTRGRRKRPRNSPDFRLKLCSFDDRHRVTIVRIAISHFFIGRSEKKKKA